MEAGKVLAAALTVLGLAEIGHPGFPQAVAADTVHAPLAATRHNPGQIARATLAAVGQATAITITLSGVPAGVTRPIHIRASLAEGACNGKPGGREYPLNAPALADAAGRPGAMAAFGGPLQLTATVDLPLQQLRTTPFAIRVRLTPADGGDEIFCGDVPHGGGLPK
jgi:hypothetical protein